MKVGLFVNSLCQAMLQDHVGGEEIIRELCQTASSISDQMGVVLWTHGASATLKDFTKPESIQELNAHLQAFKDNIAKAGVDQDFLNSLLLSDAARQASSKGVTFEQWMELSKTSFEKATAHSTENKDQ